MDCARAWLRDIDLPGLRGRPGRKSRHCLPGREGQSSRESVSAFAWFCWILSERPKRAGGTAYPTYPTRACQQAESLRAVAELAACCLCGVCHACEHVALKRGIEPGVPAMTIANGYGGLAGCGAGALDRANVQRVRNNRPCRATHRARDQCFGVRRENRRNGNGGFDHGHH